MKEKSFKSLVRFLLIVSVFMAGILFSFYDVQAAGVKTKQYTLSEKPGTYSEPFKLKIKAKKGYQLYYTTGRSFSPGKRIKNGGTKYLQINKDTTLRIYYARASVKMTKKQVKSAKVMKLSQKYSYRIGSIDENGAYTTKEDVSLYLHTFRKLPYNFITKEEARQLGWNGGGLDPYADGYCIGGDVFGNYEGSLPDGKYHECDSDTMHESKRGAKRLVYSEDGQIYYTEDHYDSFTLLYDGWEE